MCISDIRVWMINQKLKINDSKTEFIIVLSPLLNQIGVICLLLYQICKYLRLLSWVSSEKFGTFQRLMSLHNLFMPLAGVKGVGRQQLIHALITTRFDFCNSIMYNLPNNKIERVQRIQNQAARVLKRIPRRNHITPVLSELHWLQINNNFFNNCTSDTQIS